MRNSGLRRVLCSMHRFLLLLTILLSLASVQGQGLDLERLFEDRNLKPVTELLNRGEYDLVARICDAAIKRAMKSPEWRQIRLKALMLLGRHEEARDEAALAVKTYPENIELHLLQHDNALEIGRQDVADQALKAINQIALKKPAKDRTASEWVALGQTALAIGADAQKVIQQFFQVAQKKEPQLEAAYLAEGHLALKKSDSTRAANVFIIGLKAHGETANLRAGLAMAYANGDRDKQKENLLRALQINPVHAASLLLQAEALIGAENFLQAEAAIQKVLDLNEEHPEAWALRAAIAHLSAAGPDKFHQARANGMKRWNQNPMVDHIIGRVLSRTYRFAEGAKHQRLALAFSPKFLPAQIQLCQDLLKLGAEDEAWKLAASIRQADGYHVQAHNIGLLEKQMQGFTVQRLDDFILKMPQRDWPIYGERALKLLREAKAQLAPKYGYTFQRPVMVEFFDAQQDFAIRTFGSLGGQGLLGVCFGSVITMNSPGGLAHGRNNWESTLWHEFCHVVTLSQTQNKMPRWLSEGISVYEEGLHNPVWGMAMNEDFRKMILDEKKITPVGQLSSAFLNAENSGQLLFAYYQSSQVVGFLMENFGPAKFQNLLHDLSKGTRINEALEANTLSLGQLEKDFERYLIAKAEAYGPKAEWGKPNSEEVNPWGKDSLSDFARRHPDHLWVIREQIRQHQNEEQWEKILPLADKLTQLLPADFSGESGYQIKALALRKLQRSDEELQVLRKVADNESSAMPVFLRLIEVDLQNQNWTQVLSNAHRAIALNPFLRLPQQSLAQAYEALGNQVEAVSAFGRLLILSPEEAAKTHYSLAKLLRPQDATQAKRHLLEALALAPRFREGHALLRNWP